MKDEWDVEESDQTVHEDEFIDEGGGELVGDLADERDVDDGQERCAGARDETDWRVDPLLITSSRHLRCASRKWLFIFTLNFG